MNIETLKAEGWQGIDSSLAISLADYGMIWKRVGEDLHFLYGIYGKEVPHLGFCWTRFDRVSLPVTIDPVEEWDWIHFNDLAKTVGFVSAREYLSCVSLPMIVWDLLDRYGYENIFGESYYEGFAIEGLEELNS